MKKSEIYTFEDIEKFANDKVYEIIKLGVPVIGKQFLVLRKEDRDITICFILISNTSKGFNYECIYSDI